ncbi:choice-of-anchor tandem repeat GloVer-containing protein [Chlamydiota bacterium]
MNKKNVYIYIILCLYFICRGVFIYSEEMTVLYEFSGGADDGAKPYFGELLSFNNKFYGMTAFGGDNDKGVIYSVNYDGTDFTLHYEFSGGVTNGEQPWQGLIYYQGNFYGSTAYGGSAANDGIIFSINTDGTNFTKLHSFDGTVNNGEFPTSPLLVLNNRIYGMTQGGGDYDQGVIFSMYPDGSNYINIHEFDQPNGRRPMGYLLLDGDTFYGTTYEGGNAGGLENEGQGVIFSIKTDGSNFTTLHKFSGPEGSQPNAPLLLLNETLYGMTYYGGGSDKGVLFTISTTGSNYTVIREFVGGADDGDNPRGSTLLYINNKIYSTTAYGGDDNNGVIFSINTDGTDFKLEYEFTSGLEDGDYPLTFLLHQGSMIYGTTIYGGADNLGTIFSFGPIPEPTTIILLLLGFLGLIGKHIKRKHSSKGG